MTRILPAIATLLLFAVPTSLAEGPETTPASPEEGIDVAGLGPAAEVPLDVAPLARPEWIPWGSGLEPTSMDRAIVGFLPGAMPTYALGETVLGFPVVLIVRDADFLVVQAEDLTAVRAAFSALPGVSYVEDDPVAFAAVTPNDPSYSGQYGPSIMGFPTAWGSTPGYGSNSVKVAVLDTGLLRTHSDFTPSSRFLTGYDYVNGDTNPNDDCGHGTHVTGTVAATTNNGAYVAGMSQATIIPMKVLGPTGGVLNIQCSGSHSIIAQAITDAKNQGADVISMSLGGASGSTTLQNAVDGANNAGVLVVAAAGNDGASNSIDYPGAYASVIAVGAVTSTKARASYSDMGAQLDIMGAGSNIISTSSSGGTATMSGTSMATPHVAGALALALSCASTSTTNAQMKTAMQNTAEDLGAAGFDNSYGYGLLKIDALVNNICTNVAPTAAYTYSNPGLTLSVNSASSTDPNNDPLTSSWNWGDGSAAGSGTATTHTYAAGTYTVTLTVSDGRGGSDTEAKSITMTTPPPNNAPTAAYTFSTTDLVVNVNSASSTDPDSDPLSSSWNWGDASAAGSGSATSHTYASAGTYTVTLTVNDGRGGSDTEAKSVTVTAPTDPDTSTPNLANGVAQSIALSGAGDEEFWKIEVPSGKSQLVVEMTGPACGLLGCTLDADLYTRYGARPADAVYNCRPYATGNAETCTHANPTAGWWYVRVDDYSGSGTVTVKATYS